MRRLVVAILLLCGLTLFSTHRSHADVTQVNGYCFSGPLTQLVDCTPTPNGTPTATPIPQQPVKLLTVSGPTPGPYNTTSFDVGITTTLSCFALPEPTILYTLGPSGDAYFIETFPSPGLVSGTSISLLPELNPINPGAGTAHALLEVNNAALIPGGLTVKAVWPQEKVEQLQNVVPPSTPTVTPTPYPGQPTDTPTPTPTSTPTATSTPSPVPTPSGTVTPTATPTATPAPPLSVRACIQPDILKGATLGGDSAQLNGLTVPGASCTSSVLYLDATTPSSDQLTTGPFIADASGFVSFALAENSNAGGGVAAVRCALGDQIAQGCTGFLILQSGDNLTSDQQLALLRQITGLVDTADKCASIFPG